MPQAHLHSNMLGPTGGGYCRLRAYSRANARILRAQTGAAARTRAVSTIYRGYRNSVEGMARPRIYEEKRVTTAVRLPESAHDELRKAALERDVSVNYLINRAVDHYLRDLPKPG
jgi:hypothetical protein